MKEETKKNILIGILGLILLFMLMDTSEQLPKNIIPGNWDISEQIEDKNLYEFVREEADFDYSDPAVYAVANDIKDSTSDSYEAIQKTIKYVASTIQYSSKISVDSCYQETASSVLKIKQGDCVSMSRLVTALLRAQGIPARTMGGCLTSQRCTSIYAVSPLLEAKVTPMVEGDFKKRGFLHEWVEAYEPTKGWMVIEATAGQIYPMGCSSYLDYGYDTNIYDRCIISDQNFWTTCARA